jgi:Spy/CpxP family protein refolding chaperone
MKKKIMVWAVVISLVAVGVHAGTPKIKGYQGSSQGGFGLVQLMMDVSDLNITAEQKKAIRSVLQKHWREAKPLLKKLNDYRVELRDIIKSNPYDETAIRSAVQERSQVAADLAVLRGKVSAEVRSILKPEQKAKIERIQIRFDALFKTLPERAERRLNEV